MATSITKPLDPDLKLSDPTITLIEELARIRIIIQENRFTQVDVKLIRSNLEAVFSLLDRKLPYQKKMVGQP